MENFITLVAIFGLPAVIGGLIVYGWFREDIERGRSIPRQNQTRFPPRPYE